MANESLPVWASPIAEPKRSFRFQLNLNDIPTWMVKTTNRPEPSISDGGKHKFIVHEFKFPGQVTWNDIQVTLIDAIDQDNSRKIVDFLKKAGYVSPSDFHPGFSNDNFFKKSISKKDFVNILGKVSIDTLNADGKKVETWRLYNAWIKSVNFGDMDYENDSLINIQMTFSYDFATLETFNA